MSEYDEGTDDEMIVSRDETIVSINLPPADILPMENDADLKLLDQLTNAEMKLLTVIADPDVITYTVKELCEKAGISRETYYTARKKPAFNEIRQKIVYSVLRDHAVTLMKVGINQAKKGSYQHWKALMEMAGLYRERIEHTGEGGEPLAYTVRFESPGRKDVTDV